MFVSFFLIMLSGCKPYNPLIDHLSEMKSDLSSINQKLGFAPLEKMDVFSKPGVSSVGLRYQPKELNIFKSKLHQAAIEQGYVSSSKSFLLDKENFLLLCDGKREHRYLVASQFVNGEISVEIKANNAGEPLISGKLPCY